MADQAALELTAYDGLHYAYVALARWHFQDIASARAAIDAVNRMIPDEAEPDPEPDGYAFILDLHDDYPNNWIDNSKYLPLQIAMRLAGDQVAEWLDTRPAPDSVIHRLPPLLESETLPND